MTADLLSDDQLNRATLARQLLLDRADMSVTGAVQHLVGLQAQEPFDPYLGLWSRLAGFGPADLAARLEDRDLVRIVVMRGTIHLVTIEDAFRLRPVMQPVLDAEIARHPEFGPHMVGVDTEPVMAFAEQFLGDHPSSGTRLRAALAERFPGLHAPAMAYACRCYLPLVQVPPRGIWGAKGQVVLTPLTAWTARRAAPATLDEVALRYLRAFGPATVRDMASWSRLTGLAEVFECVRPRLRTFRGERAQELFDLPDAPRPPADTESPVRFLPEYDNALLSHADRSRFAVDGGQWLGGVVGPVKGTVLVGGRVRAIWRSDLDRSTGRATVVVEHDRLDRSDLDAVTAEADRAVRFWHADPADADVHLVPVNRRTRPAPG